MITPTRLEPIAAAAPRAMAKTTAFRRRRVVRETIIECPFGNWSGLVPGILTIGALRNLSFQTSRITSDRRTYAAA
jgi:hypothetical protein